MYTIKYYTIKQYTGEMRMDNVKRFMEVVDEMMTDKSIVSFEAYYANGSLFKRFVNETARPITKASPVEKGHIR